MGYVFCCLEHPELSSWLPFDKPGSAHRLSYAMGHWALEALRPRLDWQTPQSASSTAEWQRQDPKRACLLPSWADSLGLKRQTGIRGTCTAQD